MHVQQTSDTHQRDEKHLFRSLILEEEIPKDYHTPLQSLLLGRWKELASRLLSPLCMRTISNTTRHKSKKPHIPFGVFHLRMFFQNHSSACHTTPNLSCIFFSRSSWSIVPNALLRSRNRVLTMLSSSTLYLSHLLS